MAKTKIESLTDEQKVALVKARWESSSSIWDVVCDTYKQNTAIYENKNEYLNSLPERRKKFKVQANRIFPNMEAVINSLIANIPGINILPSRDGIPAQEFARKLESFLRKKYTDRNVKEVFRMALRNLYFARLFSVKAFWNPSLGLTGDFDFRAIDPRKVRICKTARKEQDSSFVIEEIDECLCALIDRFPAKKEMLMKKYGFSLDKDGEADLLVKNPDVTYKEAWLDDCVIFTLDSLHLGTIPNPYWDWDGILVTDEEMLKLEGDGLNNNESVTGKERRDLLQNIKQEQEQRTKSAIASAEQAQNITPTGGVEGVEGVDNLPKDPSDSSYGGETVNYKAYYFNYFDQPRKPFIFATIFNNENTPIGRTDMITLSAELQRGIDKRKMDIDENSELANGVLKVDASVMGKSDAQRIRFETKGIIWGKGVKDGVTRETGQALPQMVFDDMIDSRSEIDNIMAATSAFRGDREGQETKAGRLALIQQSYLRLNELVQVVDYAAKEVFDWSMQLAKTRYTETHYAKWMGKEGAREVIEIMQDDFETGSEVIIIAGKSLPKDDEFKYEQAQNDVLNGFISPVDYLDIAQYDNAKEMAKNAVLYKQNPMEAVGIMPNEMPLPFEAGSPTLPQITSLSEGSGGLEGPPTPMPVAPTQ